MQRKSLYSFGVCFSDYTCTLMPSVFANKYLQYSHGVKYLMKCADGTLYNPDKCRCDDHSKCIFTYSPVHIP